MTFIQRITALLILLAGTLPATGQELRLVTEENPPLNFKNPATGKLDGAAHEIIMAVMQEVGVSHSTEILPTHRGYRAAVENANTCFYGLNRTPAREDLFEWVGPLLDGGWAFFGYDDVPLMQSLADLNDLIVVARRGSAATVALQGARPDVRLVTVKSHATALRMLERGRAQLWLTGVMMARKGAGEKNYKKPEMKLMWRKSVLYMGCGRGTDRALITRLNGANSALEHRRAEIIGRHWP